MSATEQGEFASFARWTFVSMGDGRSEVSWTPGPDMANPVGNVHGGLVATMIDEVAAMAVISAIDRRASVPTVSLHVDFLHGIAIGATYRALGEVVRVGRAVAVADARIVDADDRVLARGTCIFQLPRTPPE
jgi:uncharacterized protein (TIGR00369 family)